MSDSAPRTIPSDDLNRFVDLFGRFEGAFDPLSSACKEAEFEFESLVKTVHHIKMGLQ